MSSTARRIMAGGAGALLLLLAAGCGQDDERITRPIVGTKPEACFEMTMVTWLGYCALTVYPGLDPVCTIDAESPRVRMTIRWDFDADGEWDTGWGPLVPIGPSPKSMMDPIWRVRCEVRDEDGNVSTAERRLNLSDELPERPDIMAGEIWILAEGWGVWGDGGVDTVEVGEEFALGLFEADWFESEHPFPIRTEFRRNREFWFSSDSDGPVDPWSGCHGWIRGYRTLDQPGTYRIEAILDADNAVNEINERNNRAVKTLVVVPARD